MSGHSKWSKVKHKKAAEDAKRSKIFSTLATTIALEAKKSSGDRSTPSLRAAIEKARSFNMPAANIKRAIDRGRGDDQEELVSVLYEAYGPGGCALVIDGNTDNKNRTSGEIKHILGERGLALSPPGSALWAFKKGGDEWVAKNICHIDEKELAELRNVLRDLEEHADVKKVYTNVLL